MVISARRRVLHRCDVARAWTVIDACACSITHACACSTTFKAPALCEATALRRSIDKRQEFTRCDIAQVEPVTALAWRVPSLSSQSMLLAAQGSRLHGLHVPTNTTVSVTNLPQHQAGGPQTILSMAVAPQGGHVATGGSNGSVHLFDSRGSELQQVLRFGAARCTDGALASDCGHGHTNRVFALEWDPEDAHVLFSGGWDRTVQVLSMPAACDCLVCSWHERRRAQHSESRRALSMIGCVARVAEIRCENARIVGRS